MNVTTRKFATLTLSVLLIMTSAACAGRQVPLHNADEMRRLTTEDPYAYNYEVTFIDGRTYYVDDDDIMVNNNLIGIRFEGRKDYQYYPTNQFRQIKATQKKRTWLGAGIGAAAGVGIGVAVGMIVYSPWKNCENAGDPDDCKMYKTALPVLLGGLGGAAGMGIGAGIGSGIPKKKKRRINVAPRVYGLEKQTINGAGLGISGTF